DRRPSSSNASAASTTARSNGDRRSSAATASPSRPPTPEPRARLTAAAPWRPHPLCPIGHPCLTGPAPASGESRTDSRQGITNAPNVRTLEMYVHYGSRTGHLVGGTVVNSSGGSDRGNAPQDRHHRRRQRRPQRGSTT